MIETYRCSLYKVMNVADFNKVSESKQVYSTT